MRNSLRLTERVTFSKWTALVVRFVLILGILAALLCSFPSAQAADDPLKFITKQVPPIPLPFQAAVFRSSIQNVGKVSVRSGCLATWQHPVRVKLPDAVEYDLIIGSTTTHGDRFFGAELIEDALATGVTVAPGYKTSTTYAFAAEWGESTTIKRMLFPVPGEYSLRFIWTDPAMRRSQFLGEPVDVRVDIPEGVDVEIVDRLRGDPNLAANFASPLRVPKAEETSKLEDLVATYPESSYADYARFALARAFVVDSSSPLWVRRSVSRDRKMQALDLLRSIHVEKFAYGPEALVLWQNILESEGERRPNLITEQLDSLFRDSIARLNDLANQLSTEEWAKLHPLVLKTN